MGGLPRSEEEGLRRHPFLPSSGIFLETYPSILWGIGVGIQSKIPFVREVTTSNLPFLTAVIVLAYKRPT